MATNNVLTLDKIPNTINWKVSGNSYPYTMKDREFTIPKGFITDLASTPRILWSVFPPSDVYTEAAVIHDHQYSICVFHRKDVDKEFKRLLEESGVGPIRRNLMYAAVRLFGGSRYCIE